MSLHYHVRSEDHNIKALGDPKVFEAVRDMIDQTAQGIHAIGLCTQGFRHMYGKKEVHKLDDIKASRCGCRRPRPKTRCFRPTARKPSTCPSAASTHSPADRRRGVRRERLQRLPHQQALRSGAGDFGDGARGQQLHPVDQRQALAGPQRGSEAVGAGRRARCQRPGAERGFDLEHAAAKKLQEWASRSSATSTRRLSRRSPIPISTSSQRAWPARRQDQEPDPGDQLRRRRPHESSRRRPGPILRDERLGRMGRRLLSSRRPVVMGPGPSPGRQRGWGTAGNHGCRKTGAAAAASPEMRALDGLELALMLPARALLRLLASVTADIVTRELGHPWLWLQEATSTMFIYAIFLGTAVATRRNDPSLSHGPVRGDARHAPADRGDPDPDRGAGRGRLPDWYATSIISVVSAAFACRPTHRSPRSMRRSRVRRAGCALHHRAVGQTASATGSTIPSRRSMKTPPSRRSTPTSTRRWDWERARHSGVDDVLLPVLPAISACRCRSR